MAAPRVDRRLAAVLAADVVGYSRLMGRDEQGTLERLKAHRREFLEPLIAEQGGRIVKLMGDGLLCEFGSAVDAVRCAVLVQQGVAEREAGVPAEDRIRLRIGINLGDVIHEDGDVYGDGVNVAARLEALAEPGGVCIARNIHNQVKGKLALRFAPMGPQRLKNIAEPVEVWRVLPDGITVRAEPARWRLTSKPALAAALALLLAVVAGAGGWWWYERQVPPSRPVETALPQPAKPSIAVLPLANLSGDPRWERLAGGITEDVITDLSRFRDLFVIARNSTLAYKDKLADVRQVGRELGVRYVLEGSLQSDGKQVRVTAQLIDTVTGNHVWSERYDRPLDDVFVIQEEVTQTTAASIAGMHGMIARADRETARRKPIASLQAYDYYCLGMESKHRFTKEDKEKAQEQFRKALELDPSYALAYVGLAWTYEMEVFTGWGASRQQSLDNLRDAALRAIALDPFSSEARIPLGVYYEYLNDFQRAVAEFDQAFELNPNNADGLAMAAEVLVRAGQPERALDAVQRAIRLNPHYPDWYNGTLSQAYFYNRRFEEAIDASRRRLYPNPLYSPLYQAMGYAQLGHDAEAAREGAALLKAYPDFSAEKQLNETGGFARDAELGLFIDSVRMAGLPMCATEEQLVIHPALKRLPECDKRRARS